ncbi:hypothetical protein BGZ63DRAFT_16344 [Mariannaea sp. PMI_226]|nr:hypothetical protein BGZ63DRAFT_16344 [Mariannaea sp. PMI_226]
MLSIKGLLCSPDDEPRGNPDRDMAMTAHQSGLTSYSQPPSTTVSHAFPTQNQHIPDEIAYRAGNHQSQHPNEYAYQYSPSANDMDIFYEHELLMKKLGSRGKGEYTCPLEGKCEYGGVRRNGSLVVFERNSAFKLHLQKHNRPYKCKLPGCSNSRGFARFDQLRRHQEHVFHQY